MNRSPLKKSSQLKNNLMKLNAMIVDDDPIARKTLEVLCGKTDLLDIVAICDSAEAALKVLKEAEPELIFLDMMMPGMDGIEFMEQLPTMPLIIFTTANQEYAYEAFEYQAIDFLKKPITQLRFLKAVEKAADYQQKLNEYRVTAPDLYVRQEGKYIRVALDDILFFENIGDYVRVRTEAGKFIIHSTLKNVEEKLNDPRFLKVHRSYIVNLQKIKDIEENTLVIERYVIPISRANRPVLMKRINVL